MSARGLPIRSVLVVGGGIAGWLAADSCRRLIPGLTVTLVDPAAPSDGVMDVYAGARPPLRGLLERLGFDPAVLVRDGGGVFRLGQRFVGWSGGTRPYLRVFGRCGERVGRVAFHQLWLRAVASGAAAPFESHSLAVALIEAGRFVLPNDTAGWPLAAFDYAQSFNPTRLAALLRAHALAVGVREDRGAVAAVETAGSDRIAAVRLRDGRALGADLFIDCTGPAARLLTALDGGDLRDDWARWLPCDRITVSQSNAPAEPPLADTATATSVGWRLTAPVAGRTIVAHCHASASATADRAERILRVATGADTAAETRTLRQGRRHAPWTGNCLALGDAAVVIEPLGAPALHLLGRMIERMVALFPAGDFAPVELGEYNRRVAADADQARDLAILPYAVARRREPFWRSAAATPLPDHLAAALALFRARGHLPARDIEDADPDAWLASLIGPGVMPAHLDPAVGEVPPADFDRAAAVMRARIGAVVADAFPHQRALDLLMR